ncbi:MAG: HNH endonuclease signature motif containing protein [Mycobacteriaceae bacterium]
MFDSSDSDPALIDAMGAAARAESVATARRLAAVGELYARRAVEWAERELWCADPFEAVAAEVSAAQNISRGRAATQIRYARELRDRLPNVASAFATGAVDFRMVSTIIARTSNVDASAIADVDAALARLAPKWMKLSGPKLIDRIDLWIAKFDADGVRVPPEIDGQRYVEVGPTTPGMGGIWANIHAADAAAFDQRLDALAATVCKDDPRTAMQRRSDAVGALAGGADRLMCACGSPDCPAVGAGGAAPVVIHLLAEQTTVNATGNTPGYLPKFGIQPAETVRDLAAAARLKPLTLPGEGAASGYRPPDAFSRFVRWRDLTCRWPGCDAPVCDVDHTVPYPLGPTHPSNLKLYCRTHHLVKTFYCGPEAGWTESQSADGTVTFTAPTGHRYSTQPAGALLYPALAVATGVLAYPGGGGPPSVGRWLAMPNRRQSRDEDRRSRIARERRRRSEINAECVQQALPADDEPPPF